uniref:Uncharacterized protein n=1 Tax=Lepeophtheirus salmonis TaxID=72036 RepID=A0A0K2VBJ7_LEPSM
MCFLQNIQNIKHPIPIYLPDRIRFGYRHDPPLPQKCPHGS